MTIASEVRYIRQDPLSFDGVTKLIQETAGHTPQVSIEFEAELGLLWLTFRPEPKPVFTHEMLVSAHKIQTAIAGIWGQNPQACPVKFLAFRGVGPIFTLGGDLDFYLDCLSIADREALAAYAHASAAGVLANMSGLDGLVTTLSTVHAKALGGGIDAPRSCHVMIAEEQATLGYPEIAFNHFPIVAAPILSRRVGALAAQQLLMTGREMTAREFFDYGLLDSVVPKQTGEDWIRRYAKANLPSHGARTTLFHDFFKRSGDVAGDLYAAADLWVDYIMKMKPADISKLQRIARMQDRMLLRLYRESASERTDMV
jgi:DSF synthase